MYSASMNKYFRNKNTGSVSPTKIIKNQRSSFVFALMKCSKSRIWRAKQNEGNVNKNLEFIIVKIGTFGKNQLNFLFFTNILVQLKK